MLYGIAQGGWAEHLLTHPDPNAVFDKYLTKCKDLGYVVVLGAHLPLVSCLIELPADSM